MDIARLAPVAAATGTVGAAAYVLATGDEAWTPACPFHAMTGLWCPGCGLTRSARAVADGDIAAAIGFNVLAPLFAVAIVLAWWHWWRHARSGVGVRWLSSLPSWTGVAAAGLLVAFGVVRNIPAEPFAALAP